MKDTWQRPQRVMRLPSWFYQKSSCDLYVPKLKDVILMAPQKHPIAWTFRKTLYIFFHVTIMFNYCGYLEDILFPFLLGLASCSFLITSAGSFSALPWNFGVPQSSLLDILLLLLHIFSWAILSKHLAADICITRKQLCPEPYQLLLASICIFKCLLYIST